MLRSLPKKILAAAFPLAENNRGQILLLHVLNPLTSHGFALSSVMVIRLPAITI
jgi:hypothetical protein